MAKPDGYLLSGFTDIAHLCSQISGFGQNRFDAVLHKKTTNSLVLQNNDKNNMTIAPAAA
ncbi:hypothetical protein A5320_20625 [Rheinheimera sp. SA_1]|jgi:hypothetical protein|nr:hypothetical protein A5320_20625 [Rheinheimera sp. SA_1]